MVVSLGDERRNRGMKAKAYGQLFETMFQYNCKRAGIACTRIPDGCKTLGGANRIVRVKSPFDWICSYKGKTAMIDTKSTLTDSFPHSQISSHQIHELLHHEVAGAIAGYVIWLRKSDRIIFLTASILAKIYPHHGSVKHDSYTEIRLLGDSRAFDLTRIFTYE